MFKPLLPIFTAVLVIVIMLIVTSIVDILVSAIFFRFYSNLAFITIFGVGGIFAGVFSCGYAIDKDPEKIERSRRMIIITNVIAGLLFFSLISEIEGGEYAVPFKAYGATLAIAGWFFGKEI